MGHFILKFLRELNSATSSKSLVLAIILGLIAGFLPTINFFTLIIFFIVLIFRIPIGLFIASYAIFKILGFFLDPLFNNVGYAVLTASFLKPIWTFFYNLPFFRWSGFNNTIVMGSLVLGVILGVILYFVLDKFIQIYRSIVFEKLKKIKLLSWLIGEEKKGFIRISGIIFSVLIIFLFLFFVIFLLDPIIKYSLEFILSKATHKKVKIEKVDTSLKNFSIDIKNMQIGNLLFSKIYTQIDKNKLIWKKYKIDNLIVYAQTNKSIYDLINKENKVSTHNKFNLKISLPKPENILAKEELKSIQALRKLESDYKKVQKDLSKLNIDKYKKDLNKLKIKIKSLQNVKIKTPRDFQKLLVQVKEIKKESKLLLNSIKQDKQLLIQDKRLIQNDIKNLEIALNEDKENIKSKYEMIKNKEYLNFAESILKPKISKYVKVVSEIYRKIEPYLHSKPKKEYIRAKGIYIKFEDKVKYPDFVLVKSNVNLKTSIAKWKINLLNISNNQVLLNKRGTILLKGKSKFFDVGGNVNYFKNIKFNLYANKVKIKKLNLNLFTVSSFANIKILGLLQNNIINSKIVCYFYQPKFVSKKKFLNNLNINHFKLVILLKGDITNPNIKITSDLDKYLSKIMENKINALINKNVNKAQALLQQKINTKLKLLNINKLDLSIKKLNSLENINKTLNNQLKNIIKSKKGNILNNKLKGLFSF